MTNTLLSDLFRSALPPVRAQPLPRMPSGLYAYIYRVSGRQQFKLCLLTILVFPLTLAPLELQRRIIDDAISGAALELLVLLGVLYFVAVLVHGSLKYVRNVYQDRIAESVSRLLRLRMADSDTFGTEADEGTKQSIIAAESERFGGFVSESIGFPLLQAGIVFSVAGYMLVVAPLVAAIALAFFVPSLAAVMLLQPVVNRMSERKTVTVRELAEHLIDRPVGNDDSSYGDHAIEHIYRLRVRISLAKHAMKGLNNLFAHLGPLSVLMVGGWLAINGQAEIGTIVAFMSGYERMVGPARDLLNFYRRFAIMHVQYGLVRQAAEDAGAEA